MTAPCAIEYILVTRWRWGKGEERIGCVRVTQGTEELTTSDRLSIRVNRLALPEGGERKRNLTTTGLGEKKSFLFF